ncbi:FAD-dependent monooxygenase, partial [bacterium LRH843]|nr:FAD-dependent monooxygenase [bacterium LRH843]
MKKHIDITVLGMGIGGLAFAIAAARMGHKVELLDRMQTPGPVGSGFVLQPTGLEVLQRLGLREAVEARGATIRRMLGIVRP